MTATASELHPEVQRILAADDAGLERAIARLEKLRSLAAARRELARLDAHYPAERQRLEALVLTLTSESEMIERGGVTS